MSNPPTNDSDGSPTLDTIRKDIRRTMERMDLLRQTRDEEDLSPRQRRQLEREMEMSRVTLSRLELAQAIALCQAGRDGEVAR